MTSSIPASLSASCDSRYPGTCRLDQVGVKAPGRPTTAHFLFAVYAAMLTLAVGSPKSKNISSEGILAPALMAEKALTEETLADKAANNATTFMVY